MNRKYLGDALDYWKGLMLNLLRSDGGLRSLKVEPMITSRDWGALEDQFYLSLLRLPEDSLLRHAQRLTVDRRAYFLEIEHGGDIFLDPDTGIATSSASPICKYLKPKEVHHLLGNGPDDRVLVIYQHIGRNKRTHERLTDVVDCLRRDSPISARSYESATVAMLIISRNERRISQIGKILYAYCGSAAEERIGQW